MADELQETLAYDGGFALLTDSELLVHRESRIAENLLLKHISNVAAEEAHSFRHRGCGLAIGIVLLLPGIVVLAPDWWDDVVAMLALFRGRFLVGVLFAAIFGFMFLYGALTSRQIPWIRLRYGTTLKLIPLPGADPIAVEKFVRLVDKKLKAPGKGPTGPSSQAIRPAE